MSKARVDHVKSAGRHSGRERRRLLAASGGALALAVGSAVSVADFAGVNVASAAVSKAQSFLEMMHRRSPGVRTEAHLTKHRHQRVLAERSLPEVPEIPALAPVTPTVTLFAPPLQAALPSFPEKPPLTAAAYPPPAFFFAPPVGAVFASPPGGGAGPPGGPGGGPGRPPQQPPPEQPGAVPEPGTWAMMILGFGLSGWALRRRPIAAKSS